MGRCQNVCFHQLIAKDLRQDDQDLRELGQNDFPLKFPCFFGQMAKCSRGNCQQFIKHLWQLGRVGLGILWIMQPWEILQQCLLSHRVFAFARLVWTMFVIVDRATYWGEEITEIWIAVKMKEILGLFVLVRDWSGLVWRTGVYWFQSTGTIWTASLVLDSLYLPSLSRESTSEAMITVQLALLGC